MDVKKLIGVFLLVAAVSGSLYFILNPSKKGMDEVYLLPDRFEGCVFVYYDVLGAPPTIVEENQIVYEVPEDGIIQTSSPMDFGWAYKDNSGAYQTTIFYVDDAGNKIKELPMEFLSFGANGSYQENDRREQHYMYAVFGSDEICDTPKFYE